MSHVAQVDVVIKDLDALDAACRRLGLELVRGQQTYRWYGQSVGDSPLPEGFTAEELGTCEHAIRIAPEALAKWKERLGAAWANQYGDEPYEIGVVPRRDGKPGYALLWDFFFGGYGLMDFVGHECRKLRQAYGVEAARRQALAQGFRVQEAPLANGSVKLICSR